MLVINNQKIDPADHVGLAHAIASQYIRLRKEKVKDSDQYAEACLALVQAAEGYIPSQGPFSAVAWKVMKNALIDLFRRSQCRKRTATFDRETDLSQLVERPQNQPLVDLLPIFLADDPEETEFDRADKQLLVDLYLKEGSVAEIASRLGVSRERIYQRIRRAIEKIRMRHADLIQGYSDE
jgi:RNA polymerase sigma factor (sigma-70 family)